MGKFFDNFESWFLNYTRRILSLIVLVLLIIASIYLFMGFANTFDSVNSEITDSFSMPVYISPDESKEDTKKISKKKSSNEKKKSEWNPMTEYEDEIVEIAETLNPFWIKFHGKSAVKMLTNYVSNNIKDFAEFHNLSDEQIEDMVDSQINYVDDFFIYYVERFPDLDEEPKNITYVKDNKIMLDILVNPLGPYWEQFNKKVNEHYKSVKDETAQVKLNNTNAMGQFMYAGAVLIAIIILVLLMLIFKAENSLRRSADSREAK
jgi:hypothetical protein